MARVTKEELQKKLEVSEMKIQMLEEMVSNLGDTLEDYRILGLKKSNDIARLEKIVVSQSNKIYELEN